MATRALWAESLAPGIHKWMQDSFDAVPSLYPQIFHVESSSRAYEEDIDSTGIGYLEETGEGAPAPLEDPLQGYKTRYTHKKFRKGVSVTQEEYDDDLYRVFRKRSEMIGKAAKRTYDMQAFSVFRNGFNTAYTSYGDLKPLFSTSHTRQDGGTAQSNASANGIKLTEENLNVGALALREIKDHKGNLVAVGDGKLTLLVPLALEKTAKILAMSDLRPGTANNDFNVYDGMYTVVATRWIGAAAGGSDTAWFLLSPNDHELNFFMRKPFYTDDEMDKRNEILTVYGGTRFSFGWSAWKGLWGSRGDLATYSS